MKYNIAKPWETLDDWQHEFLKNKKSNKVLRSGRQTGKSTIVSVGAGDYALKDKDKIVLITAAVERQALNLFEKVLAYIYATNKEQIKSGKDRPTRHRLNLKNGTSIVCLPAGETGYGLRCFTIDLLIVDEAAFVPDEVYTAITPMLAVTRGHIWLLSTPFGKQGYFYRCFSDKTFEVYHVSSEDCPRKNEEFLQHEKDSMTKAQYSQEYLGEFVDELMQMFGDDLIRSCQDQERQSIISQRTKKFMGVDVGGMGGDFSTFEITEVRKDHLYQIEHEEISMVMTTETTDKILRLDNKFNCKKIYVDDNGIGFGVFSELLKDSQTKRKVIGINNASRPIDKDGRKKKILKEDLYNNLLGLMERGKLHLLKDNEIFNSLKSVQVEYTRNGMRIYGRNTHIAEGLIRSAWGVKDKSLNIYVF